MKKLAAALMAFSIVGIMLAAAVPVFVSSATSVPYPYPYRPQDLDFVLINDYWPMENTGPGEMIYASGPPHCYPRPGCSWYGISPDTGQIVGNIASAVRPGGLHFGSEVNRHYVHLWDPEYGVWDLGQPFVSVVVFPSLDMQPYARPKIYDTYGYPPAFPSEGVEYVVWGSNNFDINNPAAATWIPAHLDTIYKKGWSDVGEDKFEWCNDDFVAVWDWQPGRGAGPEGYRYIKVGSFWECHLCEPEIDAVKGVLDHAAPPPTPEPEPECGWDTTIIERGRDFTYTSLEVDAADRVHIAYGGEQLYYALWDGSAWFQQEVDRRGVGAYCSLALTEFGTPAISYYDAANGNLKYAYRNGPLNDVWGTSASNVFAVGGSGTILRYDGQAWSPMVSGTPHTLNSVWGTSATNIFAVGDSGTIRRFNGATWTTMFSGTTQSLHGVWAADSDNVFAVGHNGTILHYDGWTWTSMTSGTPHNLRAVWGASADDVFAVGDAGVILRYDGEDWTAMTSGTNRWLAGVWGTSANNVYAVGDSGLILRFNGSFWTSTTVGNDCLHSVWGTSPSNIYAVGCVGATLHYNGTTWQIMTSATTRPLFGTWGSSADNVYAVGASGVVIRYDGTVWHPMRSANDWIIQTVDSDGNVGSHTSLAFDSLNRPAISYFDQTNKDLKYAHWTGSHWDIVTVDYLNWVGEFTSLAFDPLDRPVISYYYATDQDLRLARWNGECWDIDKTVDTSGDVGAYSSLAFDAAGHPAIAYHDQTHGTLKYARWTGTAWKREVVDTNVWLGLHASLAFDSQGHPGITYFDSARTDLKYAYWNETEWEITIIDQDGDVGTFNSLDFDSFDRPHISYHDATSESLKYARFDGDEWIIETVNGVPWVGRFASLAFDPWGNPAVAYYDPAEGDLKFAYWDADTWQWILNDWDITIVDSYANVGRYASLAFDPVGNPAIAYYEVTRGNLKFARWNGNAWDIYTIDSAGDVGSHCSLAFNADGYPFISYYDATNGYLKYAGWDGDSWETSVIDNTAKVGLFSSLAFNSLGEPGVAYYDLTRGNLKYATFHEDAWKIRLVDSDGDVGRYASLQFDCLDHPAIAYHDATNGDLKYARWTGTGWAVSVVDSQGWTGLYTSLVFDPDDHPAISYHEASKGHLKLVRWNGKAWTRQVWDTRGWAGQDTSLAFDHCGEPVIAYNAITNGHLKLAFPRNLQPHQPENLSPADETEGVDTDAVVLIASDFSDPCRDTHAASQWQICLDSEFCDLVFDVVTGEDQLTEMLVPAGTLEHYTKYYWRVRYQDCHGLWSEYSDPTWFITRSPPQQPTSQSPAAGATNISLRPTLIASPFFSEQPEARHVASEWQVTDTAGDYSAPVFESLTANLTQIGIPAGVLEYETTYYWRVRYQDNAGAWSPYSPETSFTTGRGPLPPDRPVNLSPEDGQTEVSLTPTLEASPFTDPDAGDTHAASQWRITTTVGDYSRPVFDSGSDTVNLTDITVPGGNLKGETTYYWQVRYQDSQGVWSEWSAETGFATEEAPGLPVLLLVVASVIAVAALSGVAIPLIVPL